MANAKLDRKLIVTEDGSHTLYVPSLDEHYHSVHGAIQESQHVFIKSGLRYCNQGKKQLNIFEAGFGTGLNALLSITESEKLQIYISYTCIEKYPLTKEEIKALNYANLIPGYTDIYHVMHNAKWGEPIMVSERFKLLKIQADLVNFKHNNSYDLIYFDAFAPDLQPDLWSEEVFANLYANLNTGGVLVTYSAKGFVKRNLKAAGFKITKIPGPPGKREMIRAIK